MTQVDHCGAGWDDVAFRDIGLTTTKHHQAVAENPSVRPGPEAGHTKEDQIFLAVPDHAVTPAFAGGGRQLTEHDVRTTATKQLDTVRSEKREEYQQSK